MDRFFKEPHYTSRLIACPHCGNSHPEDLAHVCPDERLLISGDVDENPILYNTKTDEYQIMGEPKKYSLGFLFNDDLSKVVMIKKTKPEWQAGLMNGVGGKVEHGENYHNCMFREFNEETSVMVNNWIPVTTLHFDDADIMVYTKKGIEARFVQTTTEEVVSLVPVWKIFLEPDKYIDNIPSLIRLAIQRLKHN